MSGLRESLRQAIAETWRGACEEGALAPGMGEVIAAVEAAVSARRPVVKERPTLVIEGEPEPPPAGEAGWEAMEAEVRWAFDSERATAPVTAGRVLEIVRRCWPAPARPATAAEPLAPPADPLPGVMSLVEAAERLVELPTGAGQEDVGNAEMGLAAAVDAARSRPRHVAAPGDLRDCRAAGAGAPLT